MRHALTVLAFAAIAGLLSGSVFGLLTLIGAPLGWAVPIAGTGACLGAVAGLVASLLEGD